MNKHFKDMQLSDNVFIPTRIKCVLIRRNCRHFKREISTEYEQVVTCQHLYICPGETPFTSTLITSTSRFIIFDNFVYSCAVYRRYSCSTKQAQSDSRKKSQKHADYLLLKPFSLTECWLNTSHTKRIRPFSVI